MGDTTPVRIGILGSGKGSNFEAILKAIEAGELAAEPAVVISDVEDAGILTLAADHGIDNFFVPPGGFRARLDDSAEASVIDMLRERGVEWVVLAGFMRVLKGAFLEAFPDRIINIHPSLLPAFPGLRAWEQAVDYRVKYTGCTVHLVDRGVDTGTILGQEPVPVMDEDTPESLHRRIQEAEWRLYPRTLQALFNGHITIRGRNAIWKR